MSGMISKVRLVISLHLALMWTSLPWTNSTSCSCPSWENEMPSVNLTWPRDRRPNLNCQLASPSCPLENATGHCLPVCGMFASEHVCRNFTAPDPPTCLTAELIVIYGLPTLVEISWSPAERPWNLVGYRVKLIDTNTLKTLEVFDVPRTQCAIGPTHDVDCFTSYKCITSRMFLFNTNATYIKPNTIWKLSVQVISLPLASPGSDSITSPQGRVVEVMRMKSCRQLGCPKSAATGKGEVAVSCPDQQNGLQRVVPEICFCVPKEPTCVKAALLSPNSRDLMVDWRMDSDDKVMESHFRLLIRTPHQNITQSVWPSEALVDDTFNRTSQCELKLASRVYWWNVSLAKLSPGDSVFVQILPMLRRNNGVIFDGEGAKHYILNTAPLSTAPPVTTHSDHTGTSTTDGDRTSNGGSNGSVEAPDIILAVVMGLVAVILVFALLLVYWYHLEEKRKKAKLPYSVLGREMEKIRKVVDDFSPIIKCLERTHCLVKSSVMLTSLSGEAEAQQFLQHLIMVVKGDDRVFGVFMFALRTEGYENLFHSIGKQVCEAVMKSLHNCMYPKPPPVTPLKEMFMGVKQDITSGYPDDTAFFLVSPVVYISYSRYNVTHSLGEVMHLCSMLSAHGVDTIIDEDFSIEMAANEVQWITDQMARADFVLIVLDSASPLNLSQDGQAVIREHAGDSGYQRACIEAQILQGEMYTGRSKFILPVQIGSTLSTPVQDIPLLLRGKTRYRLPPYFHTRNQQFHQLLLRILGPQQYAIMISYYQQPENEHLHYPVPVSDYTTV